MRTPLPIPDYLVRDARLFAPGRDPLDAVCHVLGDYPRVVSELRQLRSRVAQLDAESSAFDDRLEALQRACRAILEL
jgi:hypothetical protein